MNDETRRAIEAVFRAEYGIVLASLVRMVRDFEFAEDVLSDAMAVALASWPKSGVPTNPAAWLTTAARRKAIDRLRRDKALEKKTEELAVLARGQGEEPLDHDGSIPDHRLRLMYTCCHPALALEAQVALTLKTVGGLTVPEIASAFLTAETTMYQRIVRAKRKIKDAQIPYEVPTGADLPERTAAVMSVLYLIFTEGYSAHGGEQLVRVDLVSEAIRLARVLCTVMPDEPEAIGLLALMMLHDARRAARTDATGELVVMEHQDRALWNGAAIGEGLTLVEAALRFGRPGPFQIQAAIAAVHSQAATFDVTDWQQIAALYGELGRHQPTPVVALNHAVAVAMWRGPQAGLALLDRLGDSLDEHHLFHSARAELLRRVGRTDASRAAYEMSLGLVTNETERRYLQRRLDELAS
ncbi:MAG: RNA polymerase sigma factor [Acidimicrobiia bacterium]|nr:RNA polymerase sigma factor [Acidimicrobiia bacterium]MDH4308349.1 RNA polymerase sigma factor [Acidimicrobiia bacterium]MDH5295368.1 RNA polymerase sigma factor [Acidimicrobiia bacterium]